MGFAADEVVAGLEQVLTTAGYSYTRLGAAPDTHFQVTLTQGTLRLVVRPLPPRPNPLSPQHPFPRALLRMTFAGVATQEQEAVVRRLTLAFLRVGG